MNNAPAPDAAEPSLEELLARSGASRRFVAVRSKGTDDATVRLHSEPVILGLQGVGGVSATVQPPGTSLPAGGDCCILFHYDDAAAIQAIRARPAGDGQALVVCIGCDIYSFAPYLAVHDLVDFYLMPTIIHRRVLASQVVKPVYCLPECLDPIALPQARKDEGVRGGVREAGGKRLVWFGYAESFYKGMLSLLPVINRNLADGRVDEFILILNEAEFYKKFGNTLGFRTIPYGNKTFRAEASRFDYAVLSHFSLDLHLNSYIKSPNKLVTALIAGLIPLASDTPNYRALLERHGLQRFLFASPAELDALLKRLDPAADAAAIRASGIIEALEREGSQQALVAAFLRILHAHRAGGAPLDLLPPSMADALGPEIGFRDHLADFVPSLLRAVRKRRPLSPP